MSNSKSEGEAQNRGIVYKKVKCVKKQIFSQGACGKVKYNYTTIAL